MKRAWTVRENPNKTPAVRRVPGDARRPTRARTENATARRGAHRRAQRTRNTNARDLASRRAGAVASPRRSRHRENLSTRATSDGERDGRPRERRGETSGTDAETRDSVEPRESVAVPVADGRGDVREVPLDPRVGARAVTTRRKSEDGAHPGSDDDSRSERRDAINDDAPS
jgi:hypothetical protein